MSSGKERRDIKGRLENGIEEVFNRGEISRRRVVKERAREMSRCRGEEGC